MDNELIKAAHAAAANAHAPYSGFGVGAAVRLSDGRIVIGCNFENASYGLTMCAETVALGSVTVMSGLREVRTIAVIGGRIVNGAINGSDPVRPCGRCRQVIYEAAALSGYDVEVICVSADRSVVEHHRISHLLPHAFGPDAL